jgi:hypothetical protein
VGSSLSEGPGTDPQGYQGTSAYLIQSTGATTFFPSLPLHLAIVGEEWIRSKFPLLVFPPLRSFLAQDPNSKKSPASF